MLDPDDDIEDEPDPDNYAICRNCGGDGCKDCRNTGEVHPEPEHDTEYDDDWESEPLEDDDE